MKYATGQIVKLGDRVAMGGGMTGVVIGCIDEGEFADPFLTKEWEFLGVGILVKSPEAGVVHYQSPTPDLKLIERSHERIG